MPVSSGSTIRRRSRAEGGRRWSARAARAAAARRRRSAGRRRRSAAEQRVAHLHGERASPARTVAPARTPVSSPIGIRSRRSSEADDFGGQRPPSVSTSQRSPMDATSPALRARARAPAHLASGPRGPRGAAVQARRRDERAHASGSVRCAPPLRTRHQPPSRSRPVSMTSRRAGGLVGTDHDGPSGAARSSSARHAPRRGNIRRHGTTAPPLRRAVVSRSIAARTTSSPSRSSRSNHLARQLERNCGIVSVISAASRSRSADDRERLLERGGERRQARHPGRERGGAAFGFPRASRRGGPPRAPAPPRSPRHHGRRKGTSVRPWPGSSETARPDEDVSRQLSPRLAPSR